MIIAQSEQKNNQLLNENTHFIQTVAQPSLQNWSNSEKTIEKISETRVSGKWSKGEDQIYLNFLIENRSRLSTQCLRRSTKIFKELSVRLNNKRSPQQCRMHHNKMKRYSKKLNVNSIVNFLARKHNLSLKRQNREPKQRKNNTGKQQKKTYISDKSPINFDQIEEVLNKISVGIYVRVQINLNSLQIW